jgi:starvation-inducible DNA-binding protein
VNNLVNALQALLSTNFVLYTKTHTAHWNVRGMFFFELHKLFEEQYSDLWEQVDTIAEKIRELDGFPTITPDVQQKFSLIDPNIPPCDASEYLMMLYNDHNSMIFLLNKIFKVAEMENNQAIMNYLADRLDQHAKMRWFIKATLDKFIGQ